MSRRRMSRPRDPQSGFALLLIFAMASIVAISLYYSLPRASFEAQRDKEQTLIDRGEQYKRAIQLYVRKNKRWPAKVEDLENSNSIRYLRRRYVDPMTGKDEWRAVHVGPAGVLTDSLVKPLGKDKKDEKGANTFITELQPIGGGTDPQANVNPALRKRPSDQSPTGGNPGDPTNPGTTGSPDQGLQAGNTPQNGQPAGTMPNGQPLPNGQPGQYGQPGQSGLPQQLQRPGNPTSQPPNSLSGGGITVLGGIGSTQSAPGYPAAPGANGSTPAPGSTQTAGQTAAGQGQGPGQGPGGQNSAAALIQGLLTSPRPGGAPPGVGGASTAQTSMGGGIAGFASKFEGSAIKKYNDQDEYQKWEFVYDMSKDAAVNGGRNAIPQPAGPGGQPLSGSSGQSGFGQSNSGQSGFGQSSSGPSTFGQQNTTPGAGATTPGTVVKP
jgi:hypothetical protein